MARKRSRTKAARTQTKQPKSTKKIERRVQQVEDKMLKLKLGPVSKIGAAAGGYMFGPLGAAVGKYLGAGIGAIVGTGDYQMSPFPSTYNVLTNSKQIPQFASGRNSNVICHREYLGDVTGSVSFSSTSYSLNPGIGSTFPWLCNVAENFEEYRIHGMIFEFRSTSSEYNTTNPSLGAVVMATQYNANSSAFTSKQQMENYEFAVSCKPSVSMVHGIECARAQSVVDELYVRTGSVGTQDLRLYDLGTFNIATVGMASAYTVGELWVSYCVELLKPRIPGSIGGTPYGFHLFQTGLASGASTQLGTASAVSVGNMNQSVSSGVLTFSGFPGMKVLLTYWAYAGTSITAPTVTRGTGLNALTYLGSNSAADQNTNSFTGSTSTTVAYVAAYQFAVSNVGWTSVTLTFTNQTIVGTASADIFVTELDTSLITG